MSFAVVSWIRARGHIVGATYRKALHEKNSDLIVSEDKSRMCLQNQEKKKSKRKVSLEITMIIFLFSIFFHDVNFYESIPNFLLLKIKSMKHGFSVELVVKRKWSP